MPATDELAVDHQRRRAVDAQLDTVLIRDDDILFMDPVIETGVQLVFIELEDFGHFLQPVISKCSTILSTLVGVERIVIVPQNRGPGPPRTRLPLPPCMTPGRGRRNPGTRM